MISRHFCLSSELSGAIAKRLPHAKNHFSVASSFFNQFVTIKKYASHDSHTSKRTDICLQ